MAEGPRLSVLLVVLLVVDWTYSAENIKKCENTPMKQIVCEFGSAKEIAEFDTCLCTHIAVPVTLESDKDDETPDFTSTIKSYKQINSELKSLAAISMDAEDVAKKTNQICKEIVDILAHYDGIQLDLKQSDVSVDKSLVVHFFKVLSSEIDNKFNGETTNSSLEVFEKRKEIQLVLPPNSAVMTKYYDLKKLSKFVDFFIIATHNLVDSSEQGYTYHPSRLMGTDDLLNADSLIDLVIGLGVPHSSILISLPSTASKFELKDSAKNTPRSPSIGLPITLTRQKMCEEMKVGNWTIERDEDLTAPYAFMNKTWMSFEDSVSVSIKGKYILLRDLAGAVVTDVEALDWKLTCLNQTEVEPLKELTKTFTETARKSRSAQLLSLQEQLQHPADQGFYFNNEISYSPYYIERVVTRDGEVHVIRRDTKTEFECSRQGYFRHPSGCNRFYRCVKFDQQSNYFTVYEYDCPDGLAFDEKVEVCVWPGSLSNTGACQGSSEIAPVPRNQFVCPPTEGYYADPENCRWFFACLDHAKDGYTPLTAYEFRCPFGLVFDEKTLKCDWQWKVGSCGKSGRSYVNNYGEQSYRANQFNNALYEKQPVVPYGKYSQDHRPRYTSDAADSYVAPGAFNIPYSTTSEPQIPHGSAGSYVTPSNSAQFSYGSAQHYAAPNPQVSTAFAYVSGEPFYGATEIRPSANRPQSVLHGSSTGAYATTKKPEFAYGSSAGPHAVTSVPQLFYGSTQGYAGTSRPQYAHGSAETHTVTSTPQLFAHGPSESHSTTVRPLFAYDKPNAYVAPSRPAGIPVNYEFNSYRPEHGRFEYGPSAILYHQQRHSETGSRNHDGVLHHQQNNFQSIPVNRNYDSHKNDVQYPPLRDYETYSTTTQVPANRMSNARVYSEHYSPSNVYTNPSVPYASNEHRNAHAIPAGPSLGYDSRKFDGQYRPSYEFETYSTTTPRPVAKSPETYPQSNVYAKPTSKPFEEYLRESSQSGLNEASRSQYYSTTGSPYNEARSLFPPSTNNNDGHHNPSTTQKPGLHDTSLYKDQFVSRFNFDDYLSRISGQQYPSTTTVSYTPSSVHGNDYGNSFAPTPSASPKPTVFYWPSPAVSTRKETYDVPSYSTTPKANGYYAEGHGSSSFSYPTAVTADNSIDYKSSISSTYAPLNPTAVPGAYTPTYKKPTVDYYTPSSTASDVDSVFVDELISKLSKTPVPAAYSTTGAPDDSFDIDEYIAKLTATIHGSAPGPVHRDRPLPTSVYLSTTTGRPDHQRSYPSALPTAYAPATDVPSLGTVFSARPAAAYTQRPEQLAGYSSTASDLIDYYHSVQSSLDSAFRSPLPRYHYAPPPGGNPLLIAGNYTLPRGYERDAAHDVHAAYPAYPLKPIVVEPVSAQLNAEFERYYTAGVRKNLRGEHDGKVFAVGDTNSPLVGKLEAQCDCSARKKKPTVVSTTTRTVIDADDDDDDDDRTLAVNALITNTDVLLGQVKKPSNKKLCTRPGLFRDPKQCNKFYSCNWDKWTQKYELSDFKCPIHLAFDENLSACNWPSKGPACSHDTLISYAN